MAGNKKSRRLKILAALPPHRFEWRRVGAGLLSLFALWAVPLTGFAQVDLWKGNHRAFGHPSGGIYAGGVLCVAVLGFYLVTFVLNAALGRLFCGWGCPVGEANRRVEETAVAWKGLVRTSAALGDSGWSKRLAFARTLVMEVGWATLFAGALVQWLVRPIMPWLWLVAAAVVMVGPRLFSWRFCMKACPIGLYYSAVSTAHGFGVHFAPELCVDCGLCVGVCPVNLDPKNLDAPRSEIGGLSIDGLPSRNHCLTCGDCVRACELELRTRARPIALALGRRAANRRSTGDST